MENDDKKLDIVDIANSENVAKLLSQEEIDRIGIWVSKGYVEDLGSRTEWEQRNADSFKLALQVKEEKTYPWPGASNVKFPLVTVAAMQFHARAYPATVPSTGIVKAAVYGPDFDGMNTKRSERISSHMSWQLMEEAPEWEINHDKALLTLAITGDVFKKTYFDPVLGRNKHDLVMAKDLVVNYWSKTLETAPRFTHVIPLTPNDIRENVLRGIYLDIGDVSSSQVYVRNTTGSLEEAKDSSQGTTSPVNGESTPISGLEHFCWMDLDKDGYQEPYIVTVREVDSKVLRILARFTDTGDIKRVNDERLRQLTLKMREQNVTDEEKKDLLKDIQRLRNDKKNYILRIEPTVYFTHYQFIPSPDGGFYGLGLGTLLGPVNESVDTIINQLIDSGTSNNLGGGFLGPGVSIKAGVTEREPSSWIPIGGRGDDIRKSMMPFPVVQQSPVLFQMLELLIQYGERVAGTTDIMVGVSPGQNTPAETSRNTVEQGMKVFTAIYKRIWRSMKHEFKLIYQLNRIYLEKEQHYQDITNGASAMIKQDDYLHELVNVLPAADPNVASDSQKVRQASEVLNFARTVPGTNIYEAGRRFLQAMKEPGIDILYPDPKSKNAIPPPPNPKMQLAQIEAQTKQMDAQVKLKSVQMKLMAEVEHNQAKIQMLHAQSIKLLAEAKGVESGHAIALIEAELGARKSNNEHLLKMVDMVREQSNFNSSKQGDSNESGKARLGTMDDASGNGSTIQNT